MRGLTQGEQSSSTNPVLQLFARKGEILQDPISGSFVIEEVRDPAGSVNEKVASTPLDLDLVGAGGHKLGPGRFLIPTGTTTAWVYGSYRVVYNYVMETDGRTYTQVIPFEVLKATNFPTGRGYVGYVSTFQLYDSEFFTIDGMPPDKLHPHILRESLRLEGLTERFFEPRFLEMKLDGQPSAVLFVDEAIIAMEKVEAISRSPNSAAATTSLYDASSYRVFNRHLDGLLNPDDRYNPQIGLVESTRIAGVTAIDGDFEWPYGRQNILATGIFGFTDPEPDGDDVLIGNTPLDFVQIIGTLVSRFVENPDLSNIATWKPGLVKGYKTRDQQISFYGASGNVSYTGGLTGDALIDQMLQRFVKPARLDYPERPGSNGWIL